jgi:hypothetical protein
VNPFEVVAVIIIVFFGLGIAMGIFLVIALPALRQHRYVKRHPEATWPLPPAPPAPPADDRRPPWPGQ